MKKNPNLLKYASLLLAFSIFTLPGGNLPDHISVQAVRDPLQTPLGIQGPFVHPPVRPFNLGVSDEAEESFDANLPNDPLKYVPGTEPKGASQTIANWVDTVAQTEHGEGLMPDPIMSFEGMSFNTNLENSVLPPDTNGDVSPDLFIQTVNKSIAIYNKDGSLTEPPRSFNQFFVGDNLLCDSYNRGDPVVVYDRFAQRWVVSDFAHSSDFGPFYECLAVSKTMTPTLQASDWWMYAVEISPSSLNDYPKLGVWRDGYYLSFNMFTLVNGDWEWDGVELWAFEKSALLSGAAIQPISFHLEAETNYASLLPAHALDEPQEGAPAYFASVYPPDKLQIWKFQADWAAPSNSSLDGPEEIDIAPFAIAASVPQLNTPMLLDSLSYRPMMQLIYRSIDDIESLWMNHTVASGGVGGVRWYEVRDPGGQPALYQQGTYQPDERHRWMGSLSVDQDGNMAVGYSMSGESMHPAIYYTGRLAGETPGLLPQAEQALILGSGSQTYYIPRWGDYSTMAVDPVDDCTFWYTTEYYSTSGYRWQTRIGSFRFPSCGQPKGTLSGSVRDALTNELLAGVQLRAESTNQTFSAISDQNGEFSLPLLEGTYSLYAGPLNPGYPGTEILGGLVVTTGMTTTQNILLNPAPNLVEQDTSIADLEPGGNGNGYPEPGEQGIDLWNQILNNGALVSQQISATITSQSAGVNISHSQANYPDIAAGESANNLTPFRFSIDENVACGQEMLFQKVVSDTQSTYTLDFSIVAGVPMERTPILENDVENGSAGWSTGGAPDDWAITNEDSNSPEHAWTDSPGVNYPNNSDSYLQSPTFNLNGKRGPRLSFWIKYNLEAGYDFVYLDYSLDGGATWSDASQALAAFNGYQDWHQVTIDASILENQPNVAIRFHLISDGGVTNDGIFIDDLVVSYQPYLCLYGWDQMYFPLIGN